jgi:class 3 adenylate cyclase
MCTLQYTIIGAEVNLATRLQSIAEPSGIVLSYETYSLVRKHVKARDYGDTLLGPRTSARIPKHLGD